MAHDRLDHPQLAHGVIGLADLDKVASHIRVDTRGSLLPVEPAAVALLLSSLGQMTVQCAASIGDERVAGDRHTLGDYQDPVLRCPHLHRLSDTDEGHRIQRPGHHDVAVGMHTRRPPRRQPVVCGR